MNTIEVSLPTEKDKRMEIVARCTPDVAPRFVDMFKDFMAAGEVEALPDGRIEYRFILPRDPKEALEKLREYRRSLPSLEGHQQVVWKLP